jgi:hypothetical protein
MDLYVTATKLLDLVVDSLKDQSIVVPDRVYVAPGSDIAFDCEQLTVNLVRLMNKFPGADTSYPVVTHSILRKSAEFSVTLCRCVPAMNGDGSAPSPQKLGDAASITMNDLNGLRVALETIEHKHLLVPRNVPVSFGAATSMGPLGGIAASQVSYTIELVDNPGGWR